ncbi:ACT domain-containing protein [Lachnospiraceae bacterium NSJ-143]|nr:ACT domain-containing protein [Lachnospiraceae bacterium NSJ-143]
MNCIITVLGKDKVGIIAKVCIYLSECGVNILDISQTIVKGYFSMLMIADIENCTVPFEDLASGLKKIGDELNVEIRIQQEAIFDCMHRI